MLNAIVIMFKRTACIIWWVYKYTLYFTGEFLLQRLQSKQIVSKYEPIVENITVIACPRMVRKRHILQ